MNFGDLPAQLFSPFKFVLIGLGILISLDKIVIGSGAGELTLEWLLIIILVGVLCEIIHNDYLRIRLNISAEKHRLKKEP